MPERVGAACHRRKQTRPRELLDAALALFVERGFAAARAEDIAARAGVSKATLYLYFGSKEEVLTEVRSFPSLAAFWSREVMEPARRCVTRIVVRGIERGEFRPVDPDLVVHALVLPVLFMCLHRHAIGPCVPDDALMNAPDLFTRHLEFVLEGLAQPQGDPHVRND